MKYQILIDSCGDRTEEMKRDERVTLVPLRLHVGAKEYVDDGSLDRYEILKAMEQSQDIPRSSCPSPMEFVENMNKKSEHIYVITLSEQLSGSYNSACLAKKLIAGNGEYVVHVINSKSASAGQTVLALLIRRWEEQSVPYEEICKKIDRHVLKMKTRFVLEDLTVLERNGRLSGVKARLADVLHICPVLAATPEGEICQTGQARGIKRGVARLYHQVIEDSKEQLWQCMVISHCCNEQMAIEFKTKIKKEFPDRMVKIVSTGGISTLYAGRGGMIVSYA